MLTRTSLSACATALFLQLAYAHAKIKSGDWTALLDTSEAVLLASAALLVVTVVLNGVLALLTRQNGDRAA